MKRILVSLSIIGAVAAIAIGGTIAYFSDVETSPGNTLTAGTIDLAVDDKNPLAGAVVTITDAKPSQAIVDELVVLSNVGENDGTADLHIGGRVGSGGTMSEPECVAENGTYAAGQCTGNTPADNICTKIVYDYWYDADNDDVKDAGEAGLLIPLTGVDLGLLQAGQSRNLYLSHHLDGNAGNEYQGDTCTWNIDFTLKQIGYQ